MNLDKIHTCEKSKGKIVCISKDKMGNTYCAYCHQKVNYQYYREWKDEMMVFFPMIKNKLEEKK